MYEFDAQTRASKTIRKAKRFSRLCVYAATVALLCVVVFAPGRAEPFDAMFSQLVDDWRACFAKSDVAEKAPEIASACDRAALSPMVGQRDRQRLAYRRAKVMEARDQEPRAPGDANAPRDGDARAKK